MGNRKVRNRELVVGPSREIRQRNVHIRQLEYERIIQIGHEHCAEREKFPPVELVSGYDDVRRSYCIASL